jgi:hypothetical protein
MDVDSRVASVVTDADSTHLLLTATKTIRLACGKIETRTDLRAQFFLRIVQFLAIATIVVLKTMPTNSSPVRLLAMCFAKFSERFGNQFASQTGATDFNGIASLSFLPCQLVLDPCNT